MEPLVAVTDKGFENGSVLFSNKLEKVGIISVVDVDDIIVKPSRDVESLTEVVSFPGLEKLKCCMFHLLITW